MRKNRKRSTGCVGPVLTFFFIVILIVFMSTIDNLEDVQRPSASESESTINNATTTQAVDLSQFNGEPGISAMVNVEKKSSSKFLDIDIILHNYSDGEIVELQLFVVGTDVESKVENECIALRLSDIKPDQVMRKSQNVRTDMTSVCEYQAYVTYILYADGNEWGIKEASHFSVVSCGHEVDLCFYEDGICENAVEKVYTISYSAHMVSNSHVGDSWAYGIMYNDQVIDDKDDVCLWLDSQAGPKLTVFAVEYDTTENDVGKGEILFSNILIGESETVVVGVTVIESDGRYTGNKAYIEFTVTIKRIR